MSKYLKLFETTSQYNEYINGSDVVLPNVSVAKDAPKMVYFNPYVPMNIITYEASAKLAETTDQYSMGLHTNAFSGKNGQLTMTSHTFKNGIGTIEFDGDVTSIGERAFYWCSDMTSITILSSVTSIGKSAFTYCSGLTSIVVDSDNSVYDSRDNCNAIIKTSTNELIVGCKSTVIPNTVTSIGDSAFYSCTGLTSIIIPDSVTSIGRQAFSYCTGLTSITIGSSVTSIGDNVFHNCSKLTSITSLATTAPTINIDTFGDVKTGGTLTVPSGSTGYDKWIAYLNAWTKVEQ